MIELYFPKKIYDQYTNFYQFDLTADLKTSVRADPAIGLLKKHVIRKLEGRRIALLKKTEEGLEPYADVKTNKSIVLERIVTTHAVFTNIGKLAEYTKDIDLLLAKVSNYFQLREIEQTLTKLKSYSPYSVHQTVYLPRAVSGVAVRAESVLSPIPFSLSYSFCMQNFFAKSELVEERFKVRIEEAIEEMEKQIVRHCEELKKRVERILKYQDLRAIILDYLEENEVIALSTSSLPLELTHRVRSHGYTLIDVLRELEKMVEHGLLEENYGIFRLR